MPSSGCSQLILVMLAQSVAKVNIKGEKGENQEETENLIPSEGEGVASSQIEDSENRDSTRNGTDVKSKDNWIDTLYTKATSIMDYNAQNHLNVH